MTKSEKSVETRGKVLQIQLQEVWLVFPTPHLALQVQIRSVWSWQRCLKSAALCYHTTSPVLPHKPKGVQYDHRNKQFPNSSGKVAVDATGHSYCQLRYALSTNDTTCVLFEVIASANLPVCEPFKDIKLFYFFYLFCELLRFVLCLAFLDKLFLLRISAQCAFYLG